MRRLVCVCLLMLAPAAWAAFEYQLQPRELAAGVWLLQGSTDNFAAENGGNVVNTGFIQTSSGVLVIDSGPSLRYGQQQRRLIEELTGQKVIQLLLTHHHPDHVLGNQAYRDVPIVALAGTRDLLAEQGDGMAENMYRILGDWMRGSEVVLPSEIVEAGEIELGDRRFQLLALSGHSGADLAILDQRSGVLFAGDLLFYQRALTTPNSPGLAQWQQDLKTLQALAWKQLVPGHGPASQEAEVFVQMDDYLGWLDQLLRHGAEQGADMNELIHSPIPARFADISLTQYELIRSVSHLYPQYERAAMQRLDQAR